MDALLANPETIYHWGVDRVPEGLEMSLSDRLQRARTQQLIEAGLLPADYVPELEAEPELVIDIPEEDAPADEELDEAGSGLFGPVTIEVRPIGLHLVPDTAVDLTDMPAAGDDADARCPTCSAVGVVDMADLVGHTVHYSCGRCSTMWQVRKAVVPEGTVAS